MNIVTVLEFFLVAVIVLFSVTQIFYPLWRGTPLCPLFRKERKLESELDHAQEHVVEAKIERQISVAEKDAEKIRPHHDRSAS